jgi:hypothetical protein
MKSSKLQNLLRVTDAFRRNYKTAFGAAISAACLLTATLNAQTTTGNDLPPGGVKLQVVSFGDSLSDR